MDQAILVKDQVTGGSKLLTRLRERGVEVVAAFWTKTDDDGKWYLHLVSPLVETVGRTATYHVVNEALDTLEGEWLDLFERVSAFDVKVLRPSQPLAQAVLETYREYPSSEPIWQNGGRLGSVSVVGAYVYPATLFTVGQPQPT